VLLYAVCWSAQSRRNHAAIADPHIDSADAGARAATLLLQLLDGSRGAAGPRRTQILRVRIPLLCRGNEMITEPHAAGADSYIGGIMRQAIELERGDAAVLAAGVFWGNPFTDVPELGSHVIITYDPAGDAAAEERVSAAARQLARLMWGGREVMQAALIGTWEAVEQAKAKLGEPNPKVVAPPRPATVLAVENSTHPTRALYLDAVAAIVVSSCSMPLMLPTTQNTVGGGRATVVLSDAADATSSGASGNSNEVLRALVEQQYGGRALFPIVDGDAVEAAQAIGQGRRGLISLGGSLDPRCGGVCNATVAAQPVISVLLLPRLSS
jgi:microcystin degradation protein MlrC